MNLLVLGLALWVFSHMFKRLAPSVRARLGETPGKMVVTALSLAAIVLMVMGYRRAGVEPVYTPVPGAGHLNNLLMLIAVFLMGVQSSGGTMRARMRHPMLTGTILWAVAHLLVNGDVASLVLFGGIGLWAVASMLMINAQQAWTRPAAGTPRGDLINLVVALVIYALMAGVHIWLGYNPFLGTYG